eukprot:366390-Chlamydomonas_euryale.AAC.39
MHDELRSQLPMAFGEQERKEVNPEVAHSKFKRPAVGPPRPPSKAGAGASVGPPRPPPKGAAVGPPRPPGSSAGPSSSPGKAAGADAEDVGPARPRIDADCDADIGPPRPSPGSDEEDDDDGDGDAYDDGPGDDPWLLPVTYEATLGGHERTVSTLDLDHTGSRLLTGGLDYKVRIFDFNGMKADMRSFRELEPQEGHPVVAVSWSPTGDQFIAITGSPKVR